MPKRAYSSRTSAIRGRSRSRRAPLALLLTIPLAAIGVAAEAQPASPPGSPQQVSLHRLSIEELSQIDVTSVSKHAETVSDAAAAIFVITQDDIRRAGIMTLPEALRLASGVAVGRFDGRTWAISARGFNISTANKMVVLLDGRNLFTPLFSGVFWDVQDVVLEDIDRIEVIRGPAGTLWGANAVNGVINIITRTSADTRGALVQIGGGSQLQKTAVRYGGRLGNDTTYRVYGKYRYSLPEVLETGASARDRMSFGQAGMRLDSGASGRTVFTLQSDAYRGVSGLRDRPDIEVAGGNLLGRLLHTYGSGAQIQLQAYYDGTFRQVPRQFSEHRDTVELEVQYQRSLLRTHSVVMGAGYELSRGRARPSPVLYFDPETRTSPLVNVFAQDSIAVVPGVVTATVGSKFEYNDYTAFEFQPTARVRWTPGSAQTLWGAVSRSVRMPTRFDRDLRFTGFTPAVLLRGDAAFRSETVIAYEAGYRKRFGTTLSVDVAGFVNQYDRLRTQEPTRPGGIPIVLANNMEARTAGVEAMAAYQALPTWQLYAGYTWLHERFRMKPGSRDETGGISEYNDPRHQAWLRSFVDLPGGTEADATLRFVGELPHPHVPRYAELTIHLGLRRGRSPELALVGDNLLHDQHPEFGGLTPREEYRRSVFLQATWRF